MLAKLKPMAEIIRDPAVIEVPRNNHYWKFYYSDKPALGFRDFYLKYWKGNRIVTIKPKRDRKKNIIPGKFEVYGKRGNYVFTAYQYWFECVLRICTSAVMKKEEEQLRRTLKPKGRDIARKRALTNLSWNDLFEI